MRVHDNTIEDETWKLSGDLPRYSSVWRFWCRNPDSILTSLLFLRMTEDCSSFMIASSIIVMLTSHTYLWFLGSRARFRAILIQIRFPMFETIWTSSSCFHCIVPFSPQQSVTGSFDLTADTDMRNG